MNHHIPSRSRDWLAKSALLMAAVAAASCNATPGAGAGHASPTKGTPVANLEAEKAFIGHYGCRIGVDETDDDSFSS